MHRLLLIFALLFSALNVMAREAPPAADNPELERRVMALAQELRCLVCQNQTLADSHAELAIDLKNQVREKLAQGMSEKEVVDYLVQRYGDFVLYRPPMKATTWLLWFGPFLLLIGGIFWLLVKLRKRDYEADEIPENELQRAAVLLGTTARGETQ